MTIVNYDTPSYTVTATLFKRKSEVLEPLKLQRADIQRFTK